MSEIKFGLVAEKNLSDLTNKEDAAKNLGINVSSLSILNGLSAAGLTSGDFRNLIGSRSNLQAQIDILETELSKKLALTGGTINSALNVNGVVTANLFLSPAGIPISTSTDSFWSASAGEISYGGNVRINGTLSVSSLSVNPVELIDLTDPFYAFLAYNRAIGVGEYKIPVAVGPSLSIDFRQRSLLNQVNGSSPITFTRASTATFTDSDGIIKVAAINVPCYEHDPITGECLGLQVEGQFTNLNANSTPSAGWTGIGATLVPAQGIGPMGANSFVRVQENSLNSRHEASQIITTVAGQDYTFSLFAKASGRNVILLGESGQGVAFDLTTQTVSPPFTEYGRYLSYGCRPYGNGILRCWVTIRATTTSIIFTASLVNNAEAVTYLGNGIDGVLIDGLQVVLGTRITSLIPTTGATVTKSADIPTINSPFPWLQAGLGTLCAELYNPESQLTNPSVQCVFSLNDGTANNQISIERNPFNGFLTGRVTTGGAGQALLESGASPGQTSLFAGISWQTNNINVACSTDEQTYTDTSATIPTFDRLQIGHSLGGNHFNGIIRRLFYVPTGTPEVINGIKPSNTWGQRMLTAYEKLHNHICLEKVARERLLQRLGAGLYLESAFGPSGLNRTTPDFLYVFTGVKRFSATVTLAAPRWDVDGAIFTTSELINVSLTAGVIILSSPNLQAMSSLYFRGESTFYPTVRSPLIGGLPRAINTNGSYLLYNGAFIGQLPAQPDMVGLYYVSINQTGLVTFSTINNADILIVSSLAAWNPANVLYAISKYPQSVIIRNNLSQANVDAIINQLHTVRTQAAAFLPSIALDLRVNTAPSSTGLSQITAIRAAFTSAGKTHNIQHD